MKRKILIIIFIFVALGVKAQNLNTSPMTRYGVGELFFQGNVRQLSMGNTGIADYSGIHISALNPALTGAIRPNNVIFEFAVMNRSSLYNNGQAKQWNNFSDIRHIYGGFRITRIWHTAIGLVPFSGSGYKITVNDTASIDGFVTPYSVEYYGHGSINTLFWSNSFTFFKKFTIGAKLNYNFGSFDHKTSLIFNNDSAFTSVTVMNDRNIFRKITYDLGFIYNDTIKIKTKPFVKVSIGGIYTNKQKVNSVMTKIVLRGINYNGKNFNDSIFYDTVATSSFSFPQTYGAGLSLEFNQFTFSADYIARKWSNTQIFGNNGFADSRFVGLGVEYCRDKQSTRYFKTIRYRLGTFNYKSYVQYNNTQLTTSALTAGIGLPFKSVMLNFGFITGQKGNLNIGWKENFYEVNFGITLYDLWFIKRKYSSKSKIKKMTALKQILGIIIFSLLLTPVLAQNGKSYSDDLNAVLKTGIPELYGDMAITPNKKYDPSQKYKYRHLYFKLEDAYNDVRNVEMGIGDESIMQVLDYKSLKQLARNNKLDSLKSLIRQKQKDINDFMKWHEKLAADTFKVAVVYSEYKDFLKNNQLDSAYKKWKILYKNYPIATFTIYPGGIKIYKIKMKNAPNDSIKKLYLDTLFQIYAQEAKAFPSQKYFAGGLKVYEHNNFYIRGKDVNDSLVQLKIMENYKMAKDLIKKGQDKVPEFVFPIALVNSLYLQQLDTITSQEAIDNYVEYSRILKKQIDDLNKKISNPKNDKDKKRAERQLKKTEKTLNLLDNIFTQSQISTCDNLCPVFQGKFDKDSSDMEALKKMINILGRKGCTDCQLYADIVKVIYNHEPTASSAHGLSLIFAKKKDYKTALKYLDEAIKLETVDTNKANYYYEGAQIYNELKNYIKAREYARNALSLNPKMGKAYILIATLYGNSASSVGKDAFEHATVYWVAVDKLVKAKTVDPSVADAANSLIKTYSARYPQKQDGFMHGVYQGKSYTVGGWIGETTTARYNK